jgi:acetylxylan esterase
VNFARYAAATYNGDASKVSITGTSSGAMITNVLLAGIDSCFSVAGESSADGLIGVPPNLFAAGAPFSGVPYGCFAGSGNWNSQCADRKLIKAAAA